QHRDYIKTYVHLRRSNLFDADFYCLWYPDVAKAGQDPIIHYIKHGRVEGRSPRRGRAPVDSEIRPAKVRPNKARQALAAHIPPSAMTAVATGGDESLLSLSGSTTCHFPRAADGDFGGSMARGDTALIANLEATRAAGVDFLFVPANQRSLLDRNPWFRAH